jgi:hypothetical protein
MTLIEPDRRPLRYWGVLPAAANFAMPPCAKPRAAGLAPKVEATSQQE